MPCPSVQTDGLKFCRIGIEGDSVDSRTLYLHLAQATYWLPIGPNSAVTE